MFTCCDFCVQIVLDSLGLAVGLAVISEHQYIPIIVCVCNLPGKKKKATNQRAPMNFNEHIYSH